MTRASLSDFRALDPKINLQSRLPDDESIRLRSIWVSEAYPPSKLRGLIAGLEALGVGRDLGRRDAAADHVRRYRSGMYAGGTYNLGYFARRRGGYFGLDGVPVDLPEIVERARGWLENVTPSLTIVTIQFDLADRAINSLDAPLRKDFHTQMARHSRGWSLASPENQRRDAMRGTIKQATDGCAQWIDRYLPGAFASGLAAGQFPSCLFLTTAATEPFARQPDFSRWLWVTELDNSHDAWDSVDWPGLRLRVREREDDDQWWLAGHEGGFLTAGEPHQHAYGGPTPPGWLNRISDGMCLAMSLHATDKLLQAMHAGVARSRDSMGESAGRSWSFRRLDVLRGDITSFVRDIEPVAEELAAQTWRASSRATFKPGPEKQITHRRPPGDGAVFFTALVGS